MPFLSRAVQHHTLEIILCIDHRDFLVTESCAGVVASFTRSEPVWFVLLVYGKGYIKR
jgi:hypothetical protein